MGAEPIVLDNLSPGTHTLRVFASRPWHESFKNYGAYDRSVFHVFTPTEGDAPDSDLPLLTYSRPQGSYGAEPILLDFYLASAPLHSLAQGSDEDDILDWRIRCTVNGESFILDRWEPLYLTGFKPGKNWVKLEFLDELGNPVKNVFNTTARAIEYKPGGDDTLSKLVRGELTAEEAKAIVISGYNPPEEQEAIAEPTPPGRKRARTRRRGDRSTCNRGQTDTPIGRRNARETDSLGRTGMGTGRRKGN